MDRRFKRKIAKEDVVDDEVVVIADALEIVGNGLVEVLWIAAISDDIENVVDIEVVSEFGTGVDGIVVGVDDDRSIIKKGPSQSSFFHSFVLFSFICKEYNAACFALNKIRAMDLS